MKNKKCVIIGASRGIGAATAISLAKMGAELSLYARDLAALEKVAQACRDVGGVATVGALDLADLRAVQDRMKAHDRIDFLLHNAAVIQPIGHLLDLSLDEWDRALRVNLVAVVATLQAAKTGLSASDAPTVINISSGAASRIQEGWSAYCAGKAGLAMVTRALAEEGDIPNLRAYGFRPGVVDTAMQGEIRASKMNPISLLPRDSLLPPEHPAEAIVWLASHRPTDWHGDEVDIRSPEFQAASRLAYA